MAKIFKIAFKVRFKAILCNDSLARLATTGGLCLLMPVVVRISAMSTTTAIRTTTTPVTRMERRSDSVKARQSTRFDVEINARQEGENNLSPFFEGRNMRGDISGRTLLAWSEILRNTDFMSGDITQIEQRNDE